MGEPTADPTSLSPEAERTEAVMLRVGVVAECIPQNRPEEAASSRRPRHHQYWHSDRDRGSGECRREGPSAATLVPVVTEPGRRHECGVETDAGRYRERAARERRHRQTRERDKRHRGGGDMRDVGHPADEVVVAAYAEHEGAPGVQRDERPA